jgi:undecaprenyl pyrophosphate synthase
MNESYEFQINTKNELIDLFASDVINNQLFTDIILEAITKQVKLCTEESIKNILEYEFNNINWEKISNEVGIKGPIEPSRVIRMVLNHIIVEIMMRSELIDRFTDKRLSRLSETIKPDKPKLETLYD